MKHWRLVLLAGLVLAHWPQVEGAVPGTTSPDTGDTVEVVQDSLSVNEHLGPVFLYGVQLEKPYRFTLSEDGLRLYLNGYFYAGDKDTVPPMKEISDTARAKHSLLLQAGKSMKQGKSFEESLTIYADILRSSPLVNHVRISYPWIYFTWVSSPDDEVEVMLSREPGHYELEAAFEQLMADFWRVVRSGGMITLGKGGCRMSIQAESVPKTLEQIELIRRGVPREQLDVADTPLRWDDFYYDIAHPIGTTKEE